MSANRSHIVKRLRDAGYASAEFFRSLPAADYALPIYAADGGWRLHDVLAHFLSVERTFLRYGRDILAGGEGAPEDFVIDEFNAAQVAQLRHRTADDLLQAFEAARSETVALVESMSDADLEREGRHPYFGFLPVGKMLKLIYRHNMMHERDIRRALKHGAPADAAPPPQAERNNE